MSISTQISEGIKDAMRAKDKVRLEALRAAKTAFMLANTQSGAQDELSEQDELKIIQKLVKQRSDSAAIYKEQNRIDLYEKEIAESKVLEEFLPAKMSSADLSDYLTAVIAKVGASSPQDMGKVMGVASKELAGKADGKEIATLVRQLLSS